MTQTPILNQLTLARSNSLKKLAVLIDPDKTDAHACRKLINRCVAHEVDLLLVGGSLITTYTLNRIIEVAKNCSSIPVLLFPGSNLHIDPSADAILFLSLISGRNPDLLIGQHVLAAPMLKRSSLEILPTGYLLIDGGRPTTASYISNTFPIPHDKPDIAACTAMAGEMLGLKLIYLDAGSGALQAVSAQMIAVVKAVTEVPLIVGGGITSGGQAAQSWQAGADVVVVGNGIEQNPGLLVELSEQKQRLNRVSVPG